MMQLPDDENVYHKVSRLLTGNAPDEVEQIVLQEARDIAEFAKRTCQPGDVIQVVPSHPSFISHLAIVEDVKKWGVVAFVQSIDSDSGRYYLRLDWEHFEYIGRAVFLPEDLLNESR